MTKRSLLLLSLFVVFGIVAMAPSALAQTQWTVPPPVLLTTGRPEGKAEATAPVTIAINTGGSVSANSSFTITYSTAVSAIGTVLVTCGGQAGSPWASGVCTNLASPTMFGRAVTIQFSAGMTFPAGAGSYLSVTARVDAAGVTPLPGQVTAVVTATPPAGGYTMSVSPTTAQQVLVVNAMPSLSLQYDPYQDTLVDKGTPAQLLTCIGAGSFAPSTTRAEYADPSGSEFVINIAENFALALTTQAEESIWDPGSGVSGEIGSSVTNGSNIVVTFSNVPATVGIKAAAIKPCSTLSPADPLYCAGGSLGLSLASSNTVAAPTAAGQASFTYTVTSLDAGYPENVSLLFSVSSKGSLPAGLPPMTASVAYAPTLTSPLSVPYFRGLPESRTGMAVVNFSDCVTYLLFPYVNTYNPGVAAPFARWDTGIAIANTTTDPFGSSSVTANGSAVPQSGSCTVYFYPSNGGGMVSYTSAAIPSGQTLSFDVSSPTMCTSTVTTSCFESVPVAFYNKTGYAIAICNFQNAYGWAEIWDNAGSAAGPGVLGSYVAYILPNPALVHRTPAGGGLGEHAIDPANINRQILNLLMHGDPSKK